MKGTSDERSQNFNLVSSVKALLNAVSRLTVVAVIILVGLTATARATPLTLFVFPVDYDCSGSQVTEASATGGQPPYTFTWTNVSQVWSSSGDNPNYADLYMNSEATDRRGCQRANESEGYLHLPHLSLAYQEPLA